MAEVSYNEENMVPNIFAELKNISVVNLMCLIELINVIDKGKSTINYIDYSYEVVSNYWDEDLSKVEQTSEVKLLNEVKSILITKYGLTMNSPKADVLQILGFANDRHINIKLLGVVKKSINYLKNPIDEQELGSARFDYWKNHLHNKWLCKNDFIKMRNQKEIVIDKKWLSYIRDKQDVIYNYCTNSLTTLLNGESLVVKEYCDDHKQVIEEDFSVIMDLEKRIKLHQRLDKNTYACLEVAYEWLDFTIEDYTRYKVIYDSYMRKFDIKQTVKKFPFVTSLILIYTAIYRYNDEDSNGFWPEFFYRSEYKYSEVELVMIAMKKIVNQFKINTEDRHYLEKRNLSEIFSHIYMSDVSIRKIYSAIYKYYFKYSSNQRIVNVQFFLEDNLYRLDKSGIFFFSEDNIIDNSFDKIMELFNECLDSKKNIHNVDYLPKRFLISFERWLESDKKEIDSQKDDYYIASPRIRFDIPNEKMVLVLPQQRSKVFSDERCGWKIGLDDSEERFVDGRIVKRKDGVYIILDEEIELDFYNNLEIEYLFNNKTKSKWQFENNNSFILFNEQGYYLKGDKLNRSKCVVGIYNANFKDEDYILEEIALINWEGYTFYYLDLEDINEQQLMFNGEQGVILEIDNKPSIKRSLYKLALEKWDISPSNFKGIPVYEYVGSFNFNTPKISKDDIEVSIRPLSKNISFGSYSIYEKKQVSSNNVEVNFHRNRLQNGYYNLLIKYKGKTVIRENFIHINTIEYIDGFNMSYDKISYTHEKLTLKKSPHYKIEPSHITCFVSEDDENYYIEPSNVAKAKFNLLFDDISVPIEKVILPIRWSITGLESVIDNKTDNQAKEITKQAFDNNDIRLQVSNFDYRYNTLTYKIEILEKNNNKRITEIRKLSYGDQFSLLFNNIRDRLIDFSNITIKMFIINEKQECLYEKVLLNVVKKIKMLNFKANFKEENLKLSWQEEYLNKSRVLKLYNFINPWKDNVEIELKDGITDIIIPAENIEFGSYIPVLDYKKEYSIFDNIEDKVIFFKRNELNNVINNNQEFKLKDEDLILGRLLQNYIDGNDSRPILKDLMKLEAISNQKVFMTIIQMKYLIDQSGQNKISIFINNSFELLNLLIEREGYDRLIKSLYHLKPRLSDEDLKFCSTILLAARKDKTIAKEKIDLLSDINLIDALCSVKNGSGEITKNLKSRCISTFENELLGMVRRHKEISDVIKDEIEIITSFWGWLTAHENKYILRKGYSLSRAFRIYEFKKDISSYKVNGNKMDDLVENIKCDKKDLYLCLPKRLEYADDISNEKFKVIKELIDMNMDNNYRSLLIVSFLSINPAKTSSNIEYYEMIIKEYVGNQWELFERYRAFFKLMFL
ncbi:hypothetical protein [Natronospora cellulosivora (SeqCode)]